MTTQSRFTNSYLCHHGRCGTKTKIRRPHRRSQSAICAITVDPTQKQLLDDPFEVHNRLCVPSRSIRHKYNDLTTQSRFSNSYVCHHGRCGTKTTTRRRHRGSQSAICVTTVDAAQKQRLDDPIEVHNRRAAAMIDAAQKQRLDDPIAVHNRRAAITVDATQKQRLDNPLEVHDRRAVVTVDAAQKQRLDDPIAVHNRRAVVTVDAAQNHDWMIPSRSKIGSLLSRLIRHKKERPDDPIDVHDRLFVPSLSMRHKNKKNDSTSPSRFTKARCRHGSSGTKTTTRRPHRRSQSAICAITVDPTQKQ